VSISPTEHDIGMSTKQVFDLCSACYLREDHHWDAFGDVVLRVVEGKPRPAILDAGCGPGWHLTLLARNTSPQRLIGVDFSRHMIAEARRRLAEAGLDDRVEFRITDLRRMPFECGSFDVALCMNNTLGNIICHSLEMAECERSNALGELRRVLFADGGTLILSVYDHESLELDGGYGNVFTLDRDLSRLETGDLVVRYCAPPETDRAGIPYYSHWFSASELHDLLERNGFTARSTITRGAAICVIAEAV